MEPGRRPAPAAVVYLESASDVVATVRFAAEHGVRIAFNAGGHNAGPIDWSRDTLLLKTERLDGIEIDAATRRARVGAGVLSQPLAVAAGAHGLAYLAGTSPNVGVLGKARTLHFLRKREPAPPHALLV